MAYDAFLKLDGVTGESQKDKHKGEIELLSFSWGVSNPTSTSHGTGLASGKSQHADFSVVKNTDKSSVTLFQNCCSGKHFPKATIALQKSTGGTSGETYLTYDFEKVFITHVSWAGNTSGGDSPQETVSFTYEAVKIAYKAQNADGSLGAQQMGGWNQATNSKV
jgi:type VI secretion system secreted protein Hcp